MDIKKNIKEWLCGKKLKREETIAYLLRETGWIKELEKRYRRLKEIVREAHTDRNKLATRIMKLEAKMKRIEEKK